MRSGILTQILFFLNLDLLRHTCLKKKTRSSKFYLCSKIYPKLGFSEIKLKCLQRTLQNDMRFVWGCYRCL